MQRLTSWFDQLPLRRQSKNTKNNKAPSTQRNKPKLRYSVSAAQQYRRDHPQQLPIRWTDEQHQLRSPLDQTGAATGLDTSWCSQEVTDVHSGSRGQQFNTLPANNRPKIRTNPWYSQVEHRASLRGPPRPPTNLYASVQLAPRTKRASLLGVVSSLDDSTCSSGYGSQDSSPESSALCDENGNNGRNDYHHHASPPTFHAPPPPLIAEDGDGDGEDNEFLTELTAKIEALRWKSEQVRSLISRARVERDQRLRDKQACLEQITALRQMKWVVRNNFELIL
uniref:Uncharacterized protein n=1 Tax=Plectus sambesii TaxID=2011161 RepID=A0A914VYE8_9BILA